MQDCKNAISLSLVQTIDSIFLQIW